MTRRGFIGELVAGCWSLVAGWRLLCGDEPATKSVRLGIYPGRVVPLGDIRTESKWSG